MMFSPQVPVRADVARVSLVSMMPLPLLSLMSWRFASALNPDREALNGLVAERVNL